MKHHRSPSGKRVDSRWHEGRQNARETAVDIREFSDFDRVRYNLETAGITGQDYDGTYRPSRPITGLLENYIDVRELRNR